MQNDNEYRRKALMDQMGGPAMGASGGFAPPGIKPDQPVAGPSLPEPNRGFEMPGTGSSGGVDDAPAMLAAATARNNSLIDLGNRRSKLDLFDRAGHEGLDREESSIMGAPRSSYAPGPPAMPGATLGGGSPAPGGPFQSQNKSVRGYLDEAMKAFAPQVQGIADEAGRKSAVQSYLQSLLPEVQARGGQMSDIRNEKAMVDGRMIDFYRDIEGAADPQFLDITDEGGGAAGPAGMGMNFGGQDFGGAALDQAMSGDPLAKIQQAIAQMGGSPNLDALLAQLGAQ